MELDKRIKEGKRPLTCFDLKEAEKFEGKEGYFSDCPRDFADVEIPIEQCATKGILELDERSDNCPYINKTTCLNYPYFLPAEWVKSEESEKKYRPYSLEEFFKIFKVGDLIVFRMKIFDEIRCAMFTGYITDGYRIDDKTPGACEVMLGAIRYSLFSLFEDFELFDGKEWQPFGVLDE